MRKALVALSMILIIACLFATSGCNRTGQIVNLEKMLMDGESWTYEGQEGDLIVFGEDGSFRSVIRENVENGAYEVDGMRAELTFVDKEGNEVRVEEWKVEGNPGEVDIITDQQGQDFSLKGTRETLR
jgi:hypothetical protein